METIELLFISIGLAMDAFSVSICKGLTMKYKFKRNSLLLSLSFAIFQTIMPLIGYFLGNIFSTRFMNFNYIIAFILLLIIGVNMIKESYNTEDVNIGLSIKELIILSIATSIDAMAVGITFSLFNVNLFLAIFLIGLIAFIFSFIGVKIGRLIGNKIDHIAEIIGGIILILIGFKILLEHIFS